MRRLTSALLGFFLSVQLPAATTLFLRNTNSSLGNSVTGYAGYGCNQITGAQTKLLASTTAGSAATNKTQTPSSTSPSCDITDGTSYLLWYSPPLSSGATVSGNISFEFTCNESAAQLNSGGRLIVYRWSAATGGIVSTVITSADGATECGGTRQAISGAAPTSTTFAVGDRIVIRGEVRAVGGSWAGNNSRTYTWTVDAASGSNGDTSAVFTETLSFSADSNNAPARGFSYWLMLAPWVPAYIKFGR